MNCCRQRLPVQYQFFARSEEHTSELQSLTNLVCRLLLEKKKKTLDNLFKDSSATWFPGSVLDVIDVYLNAQLYDYHLYVEHHDSSASFQLFFFFNEGAPPEIYPLSLHDALPI